MLFGRRQPAHHKVEYIVFGLGNPGARYKDTRHNVGWWVLDELAKRHKPQRTEARHRSQVDYVKLLGAHGDIAVALVKPTTYMIRLSIPSSHRAESSAQPAQSSPSHLKCKKAGASAGLMRSSNCLNYFSSVTWPLNSFFLAGRPCSLIAIFQT